MAMRASSSSTRAPATATLLRRNRSQASAQRVRVRTGAATLMASPTLLACVTAICLTPRRRSEFDARVYESVCEVNAQIDEQHERCVEQGSAHNHAVIA